jgi:gliding motility-associated lipoprotein GldH
MRRNFFCFNFKHFFKYAIAPCLILATFMLLITSCHPSADLSINVDIPKAKWNAHNAVRIEYNSIDTVATKDIFFNLRHTGQYPYNNLYLFVTTMAPNGNKVTDTLEFLLADNRGKWFGNGIGDVYNLQLVFKRNIRFGQKGRYIFYIHHGMREDELNGITDFGMLIKSAESEKASNNKK